MQSDKNERLPLAYYDFPYQYERLKVGVVLQKNDDAIYLQGDDETQFFRECNRAKQKGLSLSDVIDERSETATVLARAWLSE
jgi:hypothetical protein